MQHALDGRGHVGAQHYWNAVLYDDGLQLGTRFWDLALREHGSHSKDLVFDEPLSSFFRNVDTRYQMISDFHIICICYQDNSLLINQCRRGKQYKEIPVGDGTERIRSLKARVGE